MFFFADSYGVFGVNAVTMATIWNKTEVTSCGSAYSYMGVAYAKCGDAYYTWDLYTGVRYMRSGTLSSGKIAYTQKRRRCSGQHGAHFGYSHANALRAQRAAEAAGRER